VVDGADQGLRVDLEDVAEPVRLPAAAVQQRQRIRAVAAAEVNRRAARAGAEPLTRREQQRPRFPAR
jgi:hypothetical protein